MHFDESGVKKKMMSFINQIKELHCVVGKYPDGEHYFAPTRIHR